MFILYLDYHPYVPLIEFDNGLTILDLKYHSVHSVF